MSITDFERLLYKDLFDRFAKEEYHVEYFKSTYKGDFEALRAALLNLSDAGVLILIANEPTEICVELTHDHCYKFVEL